MPARQTLRQRFKETPMDFLAHLWLPILASAIAVFFASFLFWAVLPFHKKDFKSLPDEPGFAGFIRSSGLAPGSYAFPNCTSNAQKKDPEFQKRWKEGPSGMLNVWPTNMSMGRNMVLTFLVYLAVGIVIAYLAHMVLLPGASFKSVLRITGTAGILAYAFAFIPNAIWFCQPRGMLVRNIAEGVAYGLITGAIFAALWPGA
jgi:hypothetical protein